MHGLLAPQLHPASSRSHPLLLLSLLPPRIAFLCPEMQRRGRIDWLEGEEEGEEEEGRGGGVRTDRLYTPGHGEEDGGFLVL